MSVRFYLCPFVGTGTITDAFRPAVLDAIPNRSRWQYQDGRANSAQAGGVALCWAEVTDAEHATLLGVTGLTYVPFEDTAGNVLSTSATVGEIDATKRGQMVTFLENRHVPIQGISLSDIIMVAIRRVIARFRIRQYLKAIDYTEGFATTVNQIPANKRNAIRNALEALGFDLSMVLGSWTIRQVLVELIRQENEV